MPSIGPTEVPSVQGPAAPGTELGSELLSQRGNFEMEGMMPFAFDVPPPAKTLKGS